jgi:hypothetical protein
VLGDQDHVGAAGDAAHHRDPAGVTAHDLDDHDAVVRLGRGVEPVDRLGADRHRGVEAEGVVGSGQVVVDRLRHADDRQALLGVQARGDAERVLAADGDERIEPLREGCQHPVDAALDLVRVRPARADDRSAAREDAGDLARPERLEVVLDQPPPAGADPDDVVPAVERPPGDGADDRVQPGAVAPAGEHSDTHGRDTSDAREAGTGAGVHRPAARASRRR